MFYLERIKKELKMVNKETGFTLDKTEDVWKIYIDIDQFGENMQRKMKESNVNEIIFSMILPEKYPFVPPFIVAYSPIIHNGYIGHDGPICFELIAQSEWILVTCFSAIFRSIIHLFENKHYSIKLGTCCALHML